MRSLVRALLRAVLQRACRSRLVARFVFGVKFLPVEGAHYYFDITTFVLTRFLKTRLRLADRVLDLGTGSAAIISLYLRRHVGCHVLAADVNPAMISLARKAIAHNDAQVDVVESEIGRAH